MYDFKVLVRLLSFTLLSFTFVLRVKENIFGSLSHHPGEFSRSQKLFLSSEKIYWNCKK